MTSLDLTPWRVKKLDDDSFAYLVPDADIKADAGKMSVRVIVSTETMDRERDILIAKGCDTSDHKRNPIVLLNHRKDWPGIAQTRDPSGAYTVKAFSDHIESTNWFNQDSKLALQAFRLVESGALRGVSPGFLTVPGHVQKFKAADGHPAFVYDKWKLVEITHCPIGMNPEALVVAVEKGFGGEQLLPELKEVLIPYLPAKKAQVTSGWQEKADEGDTDALENLSGLELGDEPLEAESVSLTPSSQFYHASHAMAMKALGLVEELRVVQESERTKADARRIVALLGGVLSVCRKGHANHVIDFPDQPGVPGNDCDDIAPELMSEWRQKALEEFDAFWARQRRAVADEDAVIIQKAVQLLRGQSKDAMLPHRVRSMSKRMANELEAVKLVGLPVEADETAELAALKEKLAAGKNALASFKREKVTA